MLKSKVNGYTIELAELGKNSENRFVTLIDKKGEPYHFNMIKPDGKSIIRNPSTVPSFIMEIERDIAEIL